jgi:uncharacterized protein with LGFP repeats
MSKMKRRAATAAATLVLSLGAGAGSAYAVQPAVTPAVSAATIGEYTVNGLTYTKWKANLGNLGNPVNNKTCTSAGCSQGFQHGYILWSPSTGTRIVLNGSISWRYSTTGWTQGALGFPSSDPRGLSVRSGRVQSFQGGFIYWSPATGAQSVRGAIRGFYAANNYEGGVLGYPKTEEIPLKNGVRQDFEGGKVYWNALGGPTSATTNGDIQNSYENKGGANSWLGLPTSGKTSSRGGYYQSFQGGVIYWSPATGAQSVRGAIRGGYAANNHERGVLGYPKAEEIPVNNGVRQDFEGGKVYWNALGGPTSATTNGEIQNSYENKGGANSWLGLPTSGKTSWRGGYYQRFQGGVITWGPNIGARVINTAHFSMLANNFAKYGWPTKDSWTDGAGTHTQFQKGIYTTGAPATQPAPTKPPVVTAPVVTTPPVVTPPVVTPPVVTTPVVTPPVATPPVEPTKPVYPFTGTTATATSVVLYGDSQLDGDSWGEQGARAMGFTDQAAELAFGGLGYSIHNGWAGGTAWTAVENGFVPFPGGTPGLVMVTLGGNDASLGTTDAQIIADSSALWAKLKLMYPNSKIVVNGVMSRSDAGHERRRHIDAVLEANAKKQGITFISVAGLATMAYAEYRDDVHLTQAGQNAVAKLYAPLLAAALGR